MIISKEYGPQFDDSDGTVGEVKLVIRYAIVGEIAQANGQDTYATRKEAERAFDKIKNANKNSSCPYVKTYIKTRRIAKLWCWPNHFDSVGEVKE